MDWRPSYISRSVVHADFMASFGAVIFEINEGGIDEWPFLKGLYTATSAASTAGLSGPTPTVLAQFCLHAFGAQ